MAITQAKIVLTAIEEWDAVDKIQAMCFHTTAANINRFKGTYVLLGNKFCI